MIPKNQIDINRYNLPCQSALLLFHQQQSTGSENRVDANGRFQTQPIAIVPPIQSTTMLKIFNFPKSRVFHICRHISTTSSQWQGGELVKKMERDDAIRVIEKKPQRPPLVKNFFAHRVDTELIAYPEAIYENDHQLAVNQRRKEYADFLEENIFKTPDEVNNIRKLKEFGAFRMSATLTTETIYGNSELEAKYLSYNTYLSNHQSVIRLLYELGEESQKLKYLSKLDSGELIAVPSLFETKSTGNSKKTFTTEAHYTDKTNQWILNGEKNFVFMSPAFKDSTLFLVIAQTETVDRIGDFMDGLVVLLVDGSLPGVSISGVDQTIGIGEKPFNQVTVTFKDVALSECKEL